LSEALCRETSERPRKHPPSADNGETIAELEAHLMAEYRQRACAGAVVLLDTVTQDSL
jgi:hypothetical protein